MNTYNLNWRIIESAVTQFVNRINGKNFDLIVPIARGGLVPGTIIGYKAGIKNLYPVHLRSYTDDKQQQEIKFTIKPDLEYLCTNFKNSNILIFDDLSDTGKTFKKVVEFFDYNLCAATITTGSLYIKPHTEYVPSIYVGEFSSDTWVNFPWE